MRVLAAPDKFRGTASASAISAAIAAGAAAAGWGCVELPLADGGEGTVDAFGGPNRWTRVAGPLGTPVVAAWRLDGARAVIEMAQASGLELLGGAEGNDPLRADTRGTGQLIVDAVRLGARRIIVGVGGSASTDGGLACVEEASEVVLRPDVEVVVGCDVDAEFVGAAPRFAPQKGASAADVDLLVARLEGIADAYRSRFGVDIRGVPGAGAGGGLAGGLHALGARLVSGFDLVAGEVGLGVHIDESDLVVTGEGRLDRESLNGKVVGGVLRRCDEADVPTLVVVGEVAGGVAIPARSLSEMFGIARARADATGCVRAVVEHVLRDIASR